MGQLGFADTIGFPRNPEGASFLPTPTRVNVVGAACVVEAQCGWGHTVARASDGAVFVCGRNAHGQLGLGDIGRFPVNERGHPFQPVFARNDAFGLADARGGKHDGGAASWYGAPRADSIVQLACGSEHTAAVCASGRVLLCGNGSRGQNGLPPVAGAVLVPKLLRACGHVIIAACGNGCTVLVSRI